MLNLRKFSLNCLKSSSIQTFIRGTNYSTAKSTLAAQAIETVSLHDNQKDDVKPPSLSQISKIKEIKTSGMVAAAFASLQADEKTTSPNQKVTFNDRRISKANSVNELLAVAEENGLSRQHALKIVSVLAQWSTSGKINLSDFEADPRFVKLCRVLSRSTNNKTRLPPRVVRGDDLSMVLGVTGDDEAAKLVASITLPQMVKVMSTLAQKKRRSTPLLRSLAYNISRSSTKLDLKQCADLLYSMTVLNFPDPVLLERIGNDACDGLETNVDRSAVVGSLLTSIGLMKYKETAILDVLSEWILKHHEISRPQDIFSLFLTLAIINHHPINAESLYKTLIPQLNISDAPKASLWLDVVWSLVLLNQATSEHISSVFNPEFISKLQEDSGMSISSRMKLLNIDAATKLLMTNYNGPSLNAMSEQHTLNITKTKQKQTMVSAVLDSLGSLFPSATYLRSNIDTNMGFLIDGECLIDKKCNPLPVADSEKSNDKIRVAILVYDYHDMCRGTCVPHGSNELAARLLEAQGYKLMIVPYTEYNPRDKLVQRVQYLEKQLKSIACSA